MQAGVVVVALLCSIGYVPMQALPSRRAAMLGGLVGIAIVLLAFGLMRVIATDGMAPIAVLAVPIWLVPVGISMACGAVVRAYTVSRAGLIRRDRQAIATLCGIGFFILMIALAQAVANGLD